MRPLRAALLTVGDPETLSGGYLFHRRMAAMAADHEADVHFVSIPKVPFPLELAYVAKALGEVRAVAADVLVVDSIAAAALGTWPIRRLDTPMVGSLHQPPGGIDYAGLRSSIQAALDRRTYRACSIIMAASDSLAADLSAKGLPPQCIRVVPPGRDVVPVVDSLNHALDREEAATDSRTGLRNGRSIAVLTVGNWLPRKGIHCALEAIAQLPEDSVTLHLAGDPNVEPSYSAQLRSRIAAADLSSRVVVHGPVSLERVAELYAGADVFLLPSFSEPYGTVWGEAMASGLAVVGWTAGNLPFLVANGKEGLLLEPNDTGGLAAAIQRLSEDKALRLRMGAAAAARAATRPTWRESASLFFSAIREGLVTQPRSMTV
jgi:glycosyltransferase involved in cell wall biosynthesis